MSSPSAGTKRSRGKLLVGESRIASFITAWLNRGGQNRFLLYIRLTNEQIRQAKSLRICHRLGCWGFIRSGPYLSDESLVSSGMLDRVVNYCTDRRCNSDAASDTATGSDRTRRSWRYTQIVCEMYDHTCVVNVLLRILLLVSKPDQEAIILLGWI